MPDVGIDAPGWGQPLQPRYTDASIPSIKAKMDPGANSEPLTVKPWMHDSEIRTVDKELSQQTEGGNKDNGDLQRLFDTFVDVLCSDVMMLWAEAEGIVKTKMQIQK